MALGFKIKKFWVDLTGQCTAEGGFFGVNSTYDASGVMNPNDGVAEFDTNISGSRSMSLADGVSGLTLKIVGSRISAGGFVVTPANFYSGTTITFDATGEYADLVFLRGAWYVVGTNATVA